jgi:hypothetical protein
VIHSGLYYKPGSLKASLCEEGRKALLAFCEANEIPAESCGKVVVATREEHLSRLDELLERGLANRLGGLRRISREELREKVEKALLLCELCGAVIGTEDHVRWLARRLGPSAYTNPTVMLVSQRELGLVDSAPSPSPETPLRADRIKILCPRCRKATTLDL